LKKAEKLKKLEKLEKLEKLSKNSFQKLSKAFLSKIFLITHHNLSTLTFNSPHAESSADTVSGRGSMQ